MPRKKKKKQSEPKAELVIVQPEQQTETLPVISEEEFKDKIKAELTPEFLQSAFKNALSAVKKHGIAAFFKNPQETIADTMVGMAKDGQLSIEKENTEQKSLPDGNDRT